MVFFANFSAEKRTDFCINAVISLWYLLGEPNPKCKKTITYNASKYRCIKFKRETESSQNALIVSLSANSPSEPYLDLTNFQLLKIKEKILVTNAKNL